jgi:polysaccharide chain length determinant protein (PEP-CTERM system associated)
MEQSIDINAFVRAFKRRWWLIALPAIVLTPLAAAIAFALPAVYSATARIVVESQQIPSDLAETTVTSGVEERISLIRQRLMTRQNLLDIADRFDVFANRPGMSPTEIAETMRESTDIRGITLGRRRGQVTGIEITYTHSRPSTTAQVANEFLNLLLEQNVRQRNEQAIETTAFFNREVDRLAAELASLETALATFKTENQSALPESLVNRRSELLSLEERLFEREAQKTQMLERKKLLEQALVEGDLSLAGGRTPTAEEIELRRLAAELVQARSVYAESHPRVRSLASRIAVLDEQVRRSAANAAENADAAAGVADPGRELRRAIDEIDRELRLLEDRRVSEEGRIAELRASIERTPDVELRLNALQRRYSNVQSQYQEAVAKRAQAELGERLEVNQQAERFEVIEQAQPPGSPIAPNRPLIVAGGFAGGLALGFGFVILLEMLNRTIRTPAEFERLFNGRPIVTIPYIPTSGELSWRRRLRWAAAVALLVIAPLALYAMDRYVTPLPLLVERALEKTGLDILGQRVVAALRN